MKPTEVLIREHEVIIRALSVLRAMADRIERGQPVRQDDVARLLTFFVEFADRFHHAKEEDLLFPAMVEAGFPGDGGPIGVMLFEHEIGRGLVRRLRESQLDARFVSAAREYVTLLDNHIEKENGILFRMADQALDRRKQEDLAEAFASIELESGAAMAAQLRAVEELAAAFLPPPPEEDEPQHASSS